MNAISGKQSGEFHQFILLKQGLTSGEDEAVTVVTQNEWRDFSRTKFDDFFGL